jgi:hypothetical protein
VGAQLLELPALVMGCFRFGIAPAILTVLLSCAGSPKPVTPFDRMGDGLAIDTAFRVKQSFAVPAPFSQEYVLPVGDYLPRYVDRHGVYYASPTGVVQRSGEGEKTLEGGIHMASQPGRYFSYPSLYVDFGGGSFHKLPLPQDLARETYGSQVVFLYKGEPVE